MNSETIRTAAHQSVEAVYALQATLRAQGTLSAEVAAALKAACAAAQRAAWVATPCIDDNPARTDDTREGASHEPLSLVERGNHAHAREQVWRLGGTPWEGCSRADRKGQSVTQC